MVLQVVLTSSSFLQYIILLGKYQRFAAEVTVFLKFAVNEWSLCDHYISIKIYAPGIQMDNAGRNIESGVVKFLFVVTGSDASLEFLFSSLAYILWPDGKTACYWT
jgi:hypothetical protein